MSELIKENEEIISPNTSTNANENSTEQSSYSMGRGSSSHHHNQGSPMIPNAVLFNRTASVVFHRPRCPLSSKEIVLDYKNIEVLKKYISEKGKIIPSRITGVSRKKQSQLMQCIKRARELSLLPFSAL